MTARVVFLGTPDFAVPVLQALDNSPFEVVAVVTQPDRPVGRKLVLTPPPVKVAAERLGLPVFQPAKVRTDAAVAELAALRPDVLVTAAFGQLLPQRLLDVPAYGCLNVHASLLPRWRGAAPIQRAIMAGDTETGITIMKTVLELDAGPIVGVVRVPIEPRDNLGTVHDKLAVQGAHLLVKLLPGYLNGSIAPVPQPDEGVTYADRIVRADEQISWERTAKEIHDQVRGLSPWPGTSTTWRDLPLKIWATALTDSDRNSTASPGTVKMDQDGSVFVRCRDAWLEILEVQPSGKRRMPAESWFRGVQEREVRLADVARSS